jgi:hypothetical protein
VGKTSVEFIKQTVKANGVAMNLVNKAGQVKGVDL